MQMMMFRVHLEPSSLGTGPADRGEPSLLFLRTGGRPTRPMPILAGDPRPKGAVGGPRPADL